MRKTNSTIVPIMSHMFCISGKKGESAKHNILLLVERQSSKPSTSFLRTKGPSRSVPSDPSSVRVSS